MSNLPPEIHDYVVDLLHNEPETLKKCCLVSKSWVPRTRKHLFAHVRFETKAGLGLWKEAFPDPANSPAHHARILFIGCSDFIVAADAEVGGWVRTFSGITSLDVENGKWFLNTSTASLAPFYKFTSTIKSFHMSPILLPCPQLFDLIRSSPLLEDLSLAGHHRSSGTDGNPHRAQDAVSPTPPPLTGSLNLTVLGGMGDTVRRLLDLPGGLHFRKLTFSWDLKEDQPRVTELVEECSHTLEFLHIARDSHCTCI